MFISDFAIKRPIVTVTAMMALVAFGIAALLNLHTDEFPDIQQPIVGVTILYPGASPETVEREIVDPIEEAFSSISGVDWSKTQASATDGLAQFIVFFDFEKDVQEASQDIRDAISTQRADLPTEMEEPVLTRFDPSQQSVLSLALTSSEIPTATLTRIADPMIVRDLRTVPGRGAGDGRRRAGARAHGARCARPTCRRRASACRSGRRRSRRRTSRRRWAGSTARWRSAPSGSRAASTRRRTSPTWSWPSGTGRSSGWDRSPTARDGTEEQRDQALFNGRGGGGHRDPQGQGLQHHPGDRRDPPARRGSCSSGCPPGAKLEIVQDAGLRVHHAVRNVQEALIEGALLTVLVVFLFLNSWRSTVITGLALPVSVLASFIAVWAFGFTLNTMSLMGLSLAIGILIDDAIVVRENIVRHIEMGKDHYEASARGHRRDRAGGRRRRRSPSSRCSCRSAFMYGISGQWFKPFALTIACVGAGVAVRVLLARPDAVGLLARSRRPRPTSAAIRSPGRSTGSTSGSTGWPTATRT